jgi:hypothetical protein
MKNVLVLIMVCLLFACKKNGEVLNESIVIQKPYIISEFNKKLKDYEQYYTDSKGRKILVPPPPSIPMGLIYGTNNFIIDKDSKIYYFQRNTEIGFRCGTGWENDTIPHFISLQPKDLIEIPNNCIADFVKINYKKEVRNFTFISSELDTLKSKSYFDLIKAIEIALENRDSYFIGRTTQEEDTVLYYKKKDVFYDSKDIKWDKTKIKFIK